MKNISIVVYKLLFSIFGKLRFNRICKYNELTLNYRLNKNELTILTDIFEKREYSDYFPFYKKATIIDIGSHYGYFSIFANKNTDNQSRIISIEPGVSNFKKLTKNIRDNKLENITAINCAVGVKNEFSDFYIGKSSNNSLVMNYSLLSEKALVERIEIKTLEKIIVENQIEKIDFLKMDCEGSEYSILTNLKEEIFNKIHTISMEFHDFKNEENTGDTILKILIKNGFKIVKYEYDKTTKGLNFGKIIGTKLY